MKVIKRDGTTVDFDSSKIVVAIQKANAVVDPQDRIEEYKILEIKLGEAEARMNEMSKHGWEVASTDIYSGGMAHTKAGTPMLIVFEREIEEK